MSAQLIKAAGKRRNFQANLKDIFLDASCFQTILSSDLIAGS